MKIKLRTRVNEVHASCKKDCDFIHFDNCIEVETRRRMVLENTTFHPELDLYKDENYVKWEYLNLLGQVLSYEDNGKEETVRMVRDYFETHTRLEKEIEENSKKEPIKKKSLDQPYHVNFISWKDRITGKRYKLIFDTILWLQNDQGDTLEKIEG